MPAEQGGAVLHVNARSSLLLLPKGGAKQGQSRGTGSKHLWPQTGGVRPPLRGPRRAMCHLRGRQEAAALGRSLPQNAVGAGLALPHVQRPTAHRRKGSPRDPAGGGELPGRPTSAAPHRPTLLSRKRIEMTHARDATLSFACGECDSPLLTRKLATTPGGGDGAMR